MTQPTLDAVTTTEEQASAGPALPRTLAGKLTVAGCVLGALALLLWAVIHFGTQRDAPQADAANAVSADTSGALEVVSATVWADPPLYGGTCPATITLRGDLHLSGAEGTVRYRWNWDTKNDSDEFTVHIPAGMTTYTLTSEAHLGDPLSPSLKHVEDAVALEILGPNKLSSTTAPVEVRCS